MLRDLTRSLAVDLPSDASEQVEHYLGHNEFELAFDRLIWAIGWNRLPITSEDLDRINAAGIELGLDSAEWPGLAKLVEDPNVFGPPEGQKANLRVLEIGDARVVVELANFRAVEAIRRLLVAAIDSEDCEQRYGVTPQEAAEMRNALHAVGLEMSKARHARYHRDGTPRMQT